MAVQSKKVHLGSDSDLDQPPWCSQGIRGLPSRWRSCRSCRLMIGLFDAMQATLEVHAVNYTCLYRFGPGGSKPSSKQADVRPRCFDRVATVMPEQKK